MNKDSLVLAIGKMKPKGMKHEEDDDDMDSDQSDTDPGLESAFEDLVHAIKSNDSAAGVEALKAFIDQCDSDYDEKEDDDHSDSGF